MDAESMVCNDMGVLDGLLGMKSATSGMGKVVNDADPKPSVRWSKSKLMNWRLTKGGHS